MPENAYILKKPFNQRCFTDLEIKIKNRSLEAHKVFLASSSSVLRKRLWKNQQSNVLELNDLDFEVAEQMINFVYDGKVERMEKYSKELLMVSEQYGMKHLKKYCEKYFFENLNVKNVFETLRLSIKYRALELRRECLDIIKK
jgi:speckle-type POZ protein